MTAPPSYYPTFHCLGGACPDTCCRDWDIVLDQETIADYQTAPAPLASRLVRNLTTDEDGETCFRLNDRGFCAMLTEDGLCSIQKEWGAEHLCQHCAAYPRFIEEYGSLTESSLALSCPETARLLLEAPAFVVEESNNGHPDEPYPNIPLALMSSLELSRKKALDVMAQDRYTVWERIHGVLLLAYSVQEDLDRLDYSHAGTHCVPMQPLSASLRAKTFAQDLLGFFPSLEPLRLSWPQRLRRCQDSLDAMRTEEYSLLCCRFEAQFPRWQCHLSNLMSYLIFRHWHKTVNDDQLYARVAWIACSGILLYHLFLMQWMEDDTLRLSDEIAICCAFSREVEHMEENLELALDTCSALSPASIHYPLT